MRSCHCDEESNHITLISSDYKIASFLAMTVWLHKFRAQLGVYARLLDILVPATYGSCADDISFR